MKPRSLFSYGSLLTLPVAAAVIAVWARSARAQETVYLSTLDLSKVDQGWRKPQADKSLEGHPLSIAGQKFAHGLGTHANSTLYVDLKGGCDKFTASVGVDDEIKGAAGTVEFEIYGDRKLLWRSGVMKANQPAKEVSVDLKGVNTLLLLVTDAGDGINYDHADWADARFTVSGARPTTIFGPHEKAEILTPTAPAAPRINGARVFGVRPGHPFLFTVAATGDRPMTFSAAGLPEGLQLDAATGHITGVIAKAGTYPVTLHARNARGEATRELRIVAGDTIALTPPMGWNSWNCWARAVDDQKVRAAADAMVSSGLINHGWTYINIDDCWEGGRDAAGNITANAKFPDMKALCDYVHSKGLKIGLYSSPGPKTCGGYEGSFGHEEQDARQWAAWGFDYIKYDWCSYGSISKGNSLEELQKPYRVMRAALDKVNRDIVFSLCQYGMGKVWEWGAGIGGNCWRTTGDIRDSWGSMSGIGFSQDGHEAGASPGHWNDPDMLVVGKVGWGPNLHATHLTPNEQYTHISLWSLLSAPLLLGCDLSQLDDFTLNLLTNDEVLAIDQDPLGRPARRIVRDGDLEVWARDLADGSKTAGLFNCGMFDATVTAQWSDLGIHGPQIVRDLWRQQDLGTFNDKFETTVPPHGVVLLRLRAG